MGLCLGSGKGRSGERKRQHEGGGSEKHSVDHLRSPFTQYIRNRPAKRLARETFFLAMPEDYCRAKLDRLRSPARKPQTIPVRAGGDTPGLGRRAQRCEGACAAERRSRLKIRLTPGPKSVT